MKPFKSILFAMLAVMPMCMQAQYRSDRPLEMTFEQSDFFFSPSFLNPMGAEHFQSASVLTSDHPLIALERNPANLSDFDRDTLPSNFMYIDFRNNREIVKSGYRHYPGYYAGGIYRGWGYYHTTSRSELNPLVSLAYLTRLPVLDRSLTVGATYQLISQAEEYYAIPRDIYRYLAGKDAEGITFNGTSDYDIKDRYSASDDMYHEGHSINAFLGWEVNPSLKIGMKAGRFIFGREGSLGTENLWNQRIDYHSYWKSYKDRMQDYGHWDFSAGLKYSFDNENTLGFYLGWVNGNVLQDMNQDDESVSKNGERGTSSWSDYESWYTSDQKWDHHGNTIYSGLQWNKNIREDLSFRLMYNYSRLFQDLDLNSSIKSESENAYHYESTDYLREGEGYSDMHDLRNGGGDRTISKHMVKSAMNWDILDNQSLNVGIILGQRKQSTKTSEKVDAFSETYRYYHRIRDEEEYTSESYYKTVEDKTIRWNFDSRMRTLQIPIIYEYDISKSFDLLAGVNRTMNYWKIENSTLVLYDYREKVRNDEKEVEEMTGERITEPDERISKTSTHFLLGLTFSPSPLFSVQLLASPGFEKHSLVDEQLHGTHYWLSMTLRP